jgi:hypothetical protein
LGGQGMYFTEIENPLISANNEIIENTYSLYNVSPNPTKDFIQVHIPDIEIKDKLGLSLYDLNGRFVKSQSLISAANIRVEMGELPSGMYFLQVLDGDQARMIKVIKN